jgi:hypothetical protein
VVLLLLTNCAKTDSPGPSHLLVTPKVETYNLGDSLDPLNDLLVYLMNGNGNLSENLIEDPENPGTLNPKLAITTATPFTIAGKQIVYVVYQQYYENYFVFINDPHAPGGGSDDSSGAPTDGTSINIQIDGL